MSKMPAVVVIFAAALILAGSAPLALRSARAAGAAVPNQFDNEMPRRTTQAFAPFIRGIVSHRLADAERIFKLRRTVLASLEQPDTVRALARFIKPDELDLNLIGGRTLGQNIGILLFTVATEEGPVAFKVYYYGFGPDMFIARLDITADWDEIERLSMTVDSLPQPITMPLNGQMVPPPQQ